MKIQSLNNDKVKYWSKLYDKKFRDSENKFLIEGDHLVKEALVNGNLLEVITSIDDAVYPIDTYYVTEDILNKISNQKSIPKVIGVCKKLEEKNFEGRVLILDQIQDPGNLGTIIRSAIAFNFKNIILTNNCVDLYNDKVIRSSEGMIFNINIIRQSLEETISYLKANNYQIIGTNVVRGKLIKDLNINNNVAVIIGNEGNGMCEELNAICNEFIYIPISDACESLNAAVASSIIMYEINKG